MLYQHLLKWILHLCPLNYYEHVVGACKGRLQLLPPLDGSLWTGLCVLPQTPWPWCRWSGHCSVSYSMPILGCYHLVHEWFGVDFSPCAGAGGGGGGGGTIHCRLSCFSVSEYLYNSRQVHSEVEVTINEQRFILTLHFAQDSRWQKEWGGGEEGGDPNTLHVL